MKITYDKYANAMYISLGKKGKYSHTREVTDDFLIDFATTGRVTGIEILDARENVSDLNPRKIDFKVYDKRHASTL